MTNFKCDFPIAEYRDPGIKEYANNPLISSLPKIMSPNDAARLFTKRPYYNRDELNLPGHIRIHAISRLVNDFFVPLTTHILLEQKISTLIRQSYIGRSPEEASFKKHLNNSFKKITTGDLDAYIYDNVSSTALSMSLVGISGSGKSTTLNIILESYNRIIFHPKYNLVQIPWIKVDCPHDGTLSELCYSVFISLDRRLNTNYYAKYSSGRKSIGKLITELANLCLIHAVGLLVIDEFQHMNMAKSGGEKKMINFLVTLVNTIGVSIVLVGTPKALPLFSSEFRQARRAAGKGNVLWDRIKNNESWDDFIDEMWKYQWLNNPGKLTEDLRNTFYSLTQGIADIAIKLFCIAQARIILLSKNTAAETITCDLLHDVFEEELSVIKPMINALREGNSKSLLEFNDIVIPDIESSLINYFDIAKQRTIKKSPRPSVENLELSQVEKKAIQSLMDIGISRDVAEPLVNDAASSDPNITLIKIIQIATEAFSTSEENNNEPKLKSAPKTPSKSWNQLSEGDLRKLYSNRTGTMYESLLGSGLIYPIDSVLVS